MEFWGVEVKSGDTHEVKFVNDRLLHLSQASLGEVKNRGNESVLIFAEINGEKIVLGTLVPDRCTDISYDLVFEKEFKLSHNWKNGSVYFTGYRSDLPTDAASSDSESESDDEEDIPLVAKENGKPESKDAEKAGPSAAKAKVNIVEPKKDDKAKKDNESEDDSSSDEDSDEDSSEDGSGEDESDDEDMVDRSDESDDEEDEDESSDDEDEATPKKAEKSKKRPSESATKTPAEKKAKLVTPEKTGAEGKKGSGGHVATPHPAKQAGKTPANSEKSKQQTPRSVPCNSCTKKFPHEKALESHTKAKHSAAK